MNENELINLLEQIPVLIKAAETFKETSNHIVATLAEAVKQHPQAVIPDSEIEKLRKAITTTPCASPDIAYISKEIAQRIARDVADILTPHIKRVTAEALKDASVTVEHSHYIERNLRDIVDKKMKKKVFVLWGVIIFLLMGIGITTLSYFNGETYWGKQFYDVYTSKYLTTEEKANLKENSYLMSVLPHNYFEDTATARIQIKQYKEILKKREKEAKKKK